MKSLKIITILIVLFFTGTSFKPFSLNFSDETWIIEKQSSLKVAGKTNINSFSCIIKSYGKIDTLLYTQNGGSILKQIQLSGAMQINVHHFDCYHKIMTKDLQKTLKAEEYPHMKIRFLSFSKNPSSINSVESISGNVEIELAGVKKQMDIAYKISKSNPNQLELTGRRQILFSDFNLKPPSKLGGTIKVKNELDVEFVLQLSRLS